VFIFFGTNNVELPQSEIIYSTECVRKPDRLGRATFREHS